MAAAIMKEYRLKEPLAIESRGIVVLFPEPLNQKAEAVLISNGIHVEKQMSVQLEEEDFAEEGLHGAGLKMLCCPCRPFP